MNIKMAINSQLSATESKKQTKQKEEQRQNHGCREHFDVYQMEVWGMGEWLKNEWIKKHK